MRSGLGGMLEDQVAEHDRKSIVANSVSVAIKNHFSVLTDLGAEGALSADQRGDVYVVCGGLRWG